jgi:hypothetical protein
MILKGSDKTGMERFRGGMVEFLQENSEVWGGKVPVVTIEELED